MKKINPAILYRIWYNLKNGISVFVTKISTFFIRTYFFLISGRNVLLYKLYQEAAMPFKTTHIYHTYMKLTQIIIANFAVFLRSTENIFLHVFCSTDRPNNKKSKASQKNMQKLYMKLWIFQVSHASSSIGLLLVL